MEIIREDSAGLARVQPIYDFVHNQIAFGYEHARPTMTAWDAFNGRKAHAAGSHDDPGRSHRD